MTVQSPKPEAGSGEPAIAAPGRPEGTQRIARAAEAEASATPRPPGLLDGLRADLAAEMIAMARHLLSGGGQLDPTTLRVIRRVDGGERVPLDELCVVHANLSTLVAPATPRAIRALNEGMRAGGWRVFFGPTPEVRRLALANIFFALVFFGLSVTPNINHETIALSIYDQSGPDLLIKLLFLVGAAGLGASFGALFEVWQDISQGRFDPISESAYWMRIGLGIVAGLVLSEIISTDVGLRAAAGEDSAPPITEPLLALIGGFSAGLLHLVVTRLVKAVENTFSPPDAVGSRRSLYTAQESLRSREDDDNRAGR